MLLQWFTVHLIIHGKQEPVARIPDAQLSLCCFQEMASGASSGRLSLNISVMSQACTYENETAFTSF